MNNNSIMCTSVLIIEGMSMKKENKKQNKAVAVLIL